MLRLVKRVRGQNGQGNGSVGNAARGLIVLGCLVGGSSQVMGSSLMTIDARGGAGDLVGVSAQYDVLESSPRTYLAGTLTASLDRGPQFDAYCVDLYDTVHVGGGGSKYNVDLRSIASIAGPGGNGAGLGFLYDQFEPGIAATADGTTKNLEGAALQVALWKVEYDNGGSLTRGHFTVQDASDPSSSQHQVFSLASHYLSVYDGTQKGDATWLEATSHSLCDGQTLNQNMIGPVCLQPKGPTAQSATPEPASLVTGCLGVLGMAAYGWRRTRLAA